MTSDDQAWIVPTDDFRMLWESQDGADYPNEFVYAGPDIAVTDGPNHTATLQRSLSSGQRAALATLTRPTAVIGVTGIDARREFTDAGHHLRIVTARGDGDIVYIARQQLTDDISRGGDVSITRHPVASWTRDLVGMLPAPTGSGRLPTDVAVEFTRIPLGGELMTWIVTPPATATAAAAFAHPEPGACGTIRIQAGSITDGRAPTVIETRYRDIPDDGRYLLVIDRPGSAIPVDATGMAKMLNRVVNAVRARHDQTVASTAGHSL